QVSCGARLLLFSEGPHQMRIRAEEPETPEPSLEPREFSVLRALGNCCESRSMPIEWVLHLGFMTVVEKLHFPTGKTEDWLAGIENLLLYHARTGRMAPRIDDEPEGVKSFIARNIDLEGLRWNFLPASAGESH